MNSQTGLKSQHGPAVAWHEKYHLLHATRTGHWSAEPLHSISKDGSSWEQINTLGAGTTDQAPDMVTFQWRLIAATHKPPGPPGDPYGRIWLFAWDDHAPAWTRRFVIGSETEWTYRVGTDALTRPSLVVFGKKGEEKLLAYWVGVGSQFRMADITNFALAEGKKKYRLHSKIAATCLNFPPGLFWSHGKLHMVHGARGVPGAATAGLRHSVSKDGKKWEKLSDLPWTAASAPRLVPWRGGLALIFLAAGERGRNTIHAAWFNLTSSRWSDAAQVEGELTMNGIDAIAVGDKLNVYFVSANEHREVLTTDIAPLLEA